MDYSLSRVTTAWEKLGCPIPAPVCITVAGTNGKGSVVHLLSSLFTDAGYIVGSYTSPHLNNFNERIRVNQVPVLATELLQCTNEISNVCESTPLTFFEHTTLLMSLAFQRRNVQLAILEVGLGGRLDAVNIFPNHIACITSIDYDHCEILGNTLSEIAYEKSGIIKSTSKYAVVNASGQDSVFIDRCEELHVPLQLLGRDLAVKTLSQHWELADLPSLQNKKLPYPRNKSLVHLENLALALACVERLQVSFPVRLDMIHSHIIKHFVPGRTQSSTTYPFILFDVAHNVASCVALIWFLQDTKFCSQEFVVVSGFCKEKDISTMIALFKDLPIQRWYCVQSNLERGVSPGQLAALVTSILPRTQAIASTTEVALNDIIKNKIPTLVFGSFYVVGEAMAHTNDTI
ncbi:MAG: Mur ligase family protein [Methylacidiphilales bacterium]|nr:Mur ligase family protein [Candidatus Methylacidiphilales bacterium]